MPTKKRPIAFRFFTLFLSASVILMLAGQTVANFNYDLTVRSGLQESIGQVGEFGVQVNRAFGVGDTIIYIPLMIVSVVGLIFKKRWALLTTAAVTGISAYWTATVASIFLFGPGAPDYNYSPPPGIWLFVWTYLAFGVCGMLYLVFRGEKLIQ